MEPWLSESDFVIEPISIPIASLKYGDSTVFHYFSLLLIIIIGILIFLLDTGNSAQLQYSD